MSSEFATPANLPLLTSGWGAGRISFAEGEDFWQDAARFAAEGSLGDELDSALGGRSAPRTWVVLHERDDWALAAAAAMGLSRALAGRDQAVILLDGDEGQAAFTRQASVEEGLGWVDMIRYGSGISECGVVLPFDGRQGYFVGVGAYSPSEPTAEEISGLLRRLQRQADDVIICAPADAIGRRWAAQANLRLLCWDRATRAGGLVEGLAHSLEEAGMPLTGLVAYGLPVDTDPPLAPSEDVETMVEEKFAEQDAHASSTAVIFQDLEEEGQDIQPTAEVGRMEGAFARRKEGNSRLFVWVAVVAVLLIAVSAFYYLKYLHVPATGLFPDVVQETGNQNPSAVPAGGETLRPDLAGGGAEMMVDETAAVASPLDTEEPSAEDFGGGKTAIEGTAIDEAVTPEPVTPEPVTPDPAAPEPVIEEPVAGETVTEDPVVDKPATKSLAVPTFDMAPYTHPAGELGWALHVYSFPDTNQAVQMQRKLATRGFQTAVRAVQIKGKGRWYRIYLGSFPDKRAALGAKGSLLKKLGEDWAGVVRVR